MPRSDEPASSSIECGDADTNQFGLCLHLCTRPHHERWEECVPTFLKEAELRVRHTVDVECRSWITRCSGRAERN